MLVVSSFKSNGGDKKRSKILYAGDIEGTNYRIELEHLDGKRSLKVYREGESNPIFDAANTNHRGLLLSADTMTPMYRQIHAAYQKGKSLSSISPINLVSAIHSEKIARPASGARRSGAPGRSRSPGPSSGRSASGRTR